VTGKSESASCCGVSDWERLGARREFRSRPLAVARVCCSRFDSLNQIAFQGLQAVEARVEETCRVVLASREPHLAPLLQR
jgi:hypothetical protein